jgi:CcmD family protein
MPQTPTAPLDSLPPQDVEGAIQTAPPDEPFAETWPSTEIPTAPPDRLEQFMVQQDKLFVVVAVVLVIWFGLLFFLFRTDRRLARIERRLNEPAD